MDIFDGAEQLMAMSNATWARHANPRSVYSRIAGSVFIFFALWSLHWIGKFSGIPIAFAIAWIWLNPRLFSPPATAQSWAARGVLGERAFINRKRIPIPEEHRQVALIATAIAVLFLLIAIYGLAAQNFWAAFAGWYASVLAKLWFVDRMAWLWDVMKDQSPVYAAWSRADWDASF